MDIDNISILNLLPPNLAADKNIRMMAEAFDEVLRSIIAKIPDVEMIPNLILNRIVNETLIDLLAWQFHVDFYEPGLPIEIKRALVLKSLDWHYRKGTPSVIEEIVSTVFTRAKIQEWYEYGGRPYRFRIATEEQMPDAKAVQKLMRAINSVKNTRSILEVVTHLTDFIDEAIMGEIQETKGTLKLSDSFNYGVVKFNARVKHDGHTINDTEYKATKANGLIKFNGIHKHNYVLVPGTTAVLIPIRPRNAVYDKFMIKQKIGNYAEVFTAALKHAGAVKADGSHKFNRTGSISDSAVQVKANLEFHENIIFADNFELRMTDYFGEYFYKLQKFNGKFKHNGQIRTMARQEEFGYKIGIVGMTETLIAEDEIFIGIRHYSKHNGKYHANGKIKFNSGIMVPV
jgi:phage tail P2-like protein